jgi:hypothetical protein
MNQTILNVQDQFAELPGKGLKRQDSLGASKAITIKEFLNTLRGVKSDQKIVFQLHKERLVAVGYHVTEVKAVNYSAMDCGGVADRGYIFDFVITVCDNAKERCPFWPGQPIIAHWPSPDPADFVGTEEETYRHFWQVSRQIYRRLEIFCSLPFDKLDRLRLEHATKEIGKTDDTTAQDNDQQNRQTIRPV